VPIAQPPSEARDQRSEVGVNPVFAQEPVRVPRFTLPPEGVHPSGCSPTCGTPPDPATAVGCSTTGSSEACMLAGLALKRRWQHARRAAGRSTDRPNLVMGVNVQICWDNDLRRQLRTRGRDLRRARRPGGTHRVDVPVHVDGASGAMIAPFCDPDLTWDFRLPRVASINTSGHKYGLV
jgi:glutamate decarboxylase